MVFECPLTTEKERVDAIAAYVPWILDITDESLKNKIANVWIKVLQDCHWDRVEDACFNPTFQQQKLINHIRVTTGSAVEAAKLMNKYQGLNIDLDTVIFLGLMHDVSKFVEWEPDENVGARRSEIGKNIQHGVAGAYYAFQEKFDYKYLQLIISHTPESNNRPCCKEGFMFGLIDLADADQIAMAYDDKFPLWYDRIG